MISMITDDAEVSAKTCPKCSTVKSLLDFHANHTKPDGRNALCKTCMKMVSKNWRNKPAGRAKAMWTTAKKRAEERGWEFNLTPEWIQERLEAGFCQATGLPIELSSEEPFKGGHFRPWTPSLDRTDCTKGYTMDNVKVVCWMYNQAKGVATHSDVLRLAEALVVTHA
jgi:hypothetical protein